MKIKSKEYEELKRSKRLIMKILITGSAGFIGYHLAKHLLKDKKHKIFGLILLIVIIVKSKKID